MNKYRLKIPLFYGCQFTKGEIFRLQEKENSYENEDGYICQKWFVESNPDIFEEVEEPQEEKEEVIEGYAYTDDNKEFWIYKTGEPDGIRAVIPARLILNPKKKKEYVRWVTDECINDFERGDDIDVRILMKEKLREFRHKITITVEEE